MTVVSGVLAALRFRGDFVGDDGMPSDESQAGVNSLRMATAGRRPWRGVSGWGDPNASKGIWVGMREMSCSRIWCHMPGRTNSAADE